MAVLTAQRQKQRILIAVFLAVIFVTTAVFLIGRQERKAATPPAVTPGIPSARTTIPEELFSDESFIKLKPYSVLELPKNIGRDNPFAP